MKFSKNQPLWTSVILHLALLLGLFLVTIVEAFKPEEPPHVFEMVTPPATMQSMVQEASPTPEPEPAPELPLPRLPDVPDLVTPPEPPPVPQPVRPRPSPPAPAPEKPKLITRDQFIKEHGQPKPRPQPTQTVSTPRISVPKIDVPRLVMPTVTGPTAPQALTTQQISALNAYSAQLRARIDAAWGKPENLGGVQIAATVEFDVSATGRISNVRLKPSSGNQAFDQSVLAAFRRVTSAGATPTGQPHTFTMTFRLAD